VIRMIREIAFEHDARARRSCFVGIARRAASGPAAHERTFRLATIGPRTCRSSSRRRPSST
jgi:hypothetical protein